MVDVSDIFYFFRSARGKGEFEAPGRGVGSVFFENPRRGGFCEGKGPRGWEGVCGELGNFGVGGGAKYFFSGSKRPPRKSKRVFVSQERVSGFPEKGADLRGSLGNFRGSLGDFRGSLGNFGEPLDCC